MKYIHKPTKHTVLVTVIVVVALGLIAWGAVIADQHHKLNQTKANQEAVVRAETAQKQADQIKSYQAQLVQVTNDKTQACTVLKQLTTKPRVVYVAPSYCQ